MAEREAEHRRIVVETPTERREVEHTEAVRHSNGGVSGAALAAIVVGVIALAARDGREAGRFERASKITTIA